MANRTTFMPLRVKILSYAIYAIYCRAPTPQGWSGSFKQLPQHLSVRISKKLSRIIALLTDPKFAPYLDR
ncbi:unnamed protein product, partial [marine sediment metagenome]